MKILLVYPEYPDTFWSFKHALKFISKKASSPPLGLLTVAAMLPEDWEKKLVDINISSLSDRDLEWADYVFLSAMSIQKESVAKIIDQCKKVGAKIVAGGPYFTTEFDNFDDVDYLVLNEAEITLPLFLKDLAAGRPQHIYRADSWADLNDTPAPLLKLLDMKKYASMNIQYSRGCPYSCEFCDITQLLGRTPRTKSREQIITELESLYSHGWRSGVFFVDDNFIGNRKKLKNEILPDITNWMEKRKHPFTFITELSINIADDEELMKFMVDAGFDSVFVGIETPNEESLAECNKFQNKNRDLVACVKKIHQSGLQVQGGFIVGFDNDPPSIFERLISFIQESGIVVAMVGLLNAPRGTKLYQRMTDEKRILKDISGNNTDLTMNFIPKMNYEALVKDYKRIISTIYAPKHYYKRVRTFLREYKPLQKKAFRINMRDFRPLIGSIIRLGIIGRERYQYWKLFIWTIFRRPRLLPLAITLAIYGFHFRKVFEDY